jgi:hypothetical protein
MSESNMSDSVDTELEIVQSDADPSDAMERFGIETERICHHLQDDVDAVYAGRSYERDGIDEVDISEYGWLGNPFTDGSNKKMTRDFEEYLDEQLKQDPQLAGALSALAGERLACYCQQEHEDDTWCHGIVIAAYADYLEQIRRQRAQQ